MIDLHGEYLFRLGEIEQNEFVEKAFHLYREKGFPYLDYSEDKLILEYKKYVKSIKNLSNVKREIKYSIFGLPIVNYFHPEMWSVKCERFRTPMEVFEDDTMFFDCLKKAIKIAKDRKPFSANNVRSMLATYKNTKRVSNFRPTVARFLYEQYSNDNDSILDLAAGYGGRLMGTLPLARTYIGIDPNKITIENNCKIYDFFKHLSPCQVELHNDCAEDKLKSLKSDSVDLVIFSPPYFKRERYSNENSQSWIRYPSYENWLINFLANIFYETKRVLKKDGYFIFIITNTESHKLLDDSLSLLKEIFNFHYKYKMMIGSVPYHKNGFRGGFRNEPIYIFKNQMK